MSTAGESHGPYELCIIEGIPAGLTVTPGAIDAELARRQRGYGRGERMGVECDRCEIAAGVRHGRTLGSPIAILVANTDHTNWSAVMSVVPLRSDASREGGVEETTPRPGHADYAGMVKYGHAGKRAVSERASARETVARVAAGAVCKRLLQELGVQVRGRVMSIGEVHASTDVDYTRPSQVDWEAVESSPVACDDDQASRDMCQAVDRARASGESLGGVFEVWCWGVCPGLGGYSCMDERLDGRLLGALGSIPAIKGVEVARAFSDAVRVGSEVHDPFRIESTSGARWITRESNRAGGLEGGMTNGMPVVLRAAMKPIPTLTRPLPSVDLKSLEPASAPVERSDVTAVPAALVVGEAVVAYVIARAYVDKFGGDSMLELQSSLSAYVKGLEDRGLWRRS
jgi:chorismate synthase